MAFSVSLAVLDILSAVPGAGHSGLQMALAYVKFQKATQRS